MNMRCPISILEYGTVQLPNYPANKVIDNLFQDISLFDGWGFKRLWLTEHYSDEYAWHDPEILIPLLAGYSERIKIGIAGTLLAYHSPMRIAQNFKILSSIFPERIDLGLARASVAKKFSDYLVSSSNTFNAKTEWDKNLALLFSFLNDNDLDDNSVDRILIPLQNGLNPQTWLLGVSNTSLENAMKYDSNLCFSLIHPGANFQTAQDNLAKFRDFNISKSKRVTSILITCLLTENKSLIKKLNDRYNTNGSTGLFGGKDYIIGGLINLHQQLKNDEFVVYCPTSSRDLKLKTFEILHSIISNHSV